MRGKKLGFRHSNSIQEVRKLVSEGLSLQSVALITNIPPTTLRRMATDILKSRKEEWERDQERARELYQSGMTCSEVAPILNRGRAFVESACKNILRPWRENMLGEKNPAWRGGKVDLRKQIRESAKYKEWRKSVFERDNYTCQISGKKGNRLVVDHIKPFALILEENNITTLDEALRCGELWDISNGTTLTEEAHKQTDTYGWRTYFKLRLKI